MSDKRPDDVLTDLDLDPNEASGLVRVRNAALLEHFGFDRGFWAVLDEQDITECVVLLGHAAGEDLSQGWSVEKLQAERADAGELAKDAEAVAFWDGYVYAFGSHHGHKEGPLLREVQWVARFSEAAAVPGGQGGELRATVTVADTAFRMHRLVNDALRDSDVELIDLRDDTRRDFIDGTIDELAGTPQEGLVRPGDYPLNFEGADFTADGMLLLGLRFPVTDEGHPVIVGFRDYERLFDGGLPDVAAIWHVDAVGRDGGLAGVRDLCTTGDELHVVSGDLDSAGKGSVIRADYPQGASTVATHFVTHLAGSEGGGLQARVVKEFPDNPRIEGIAVGEDGRFFYVSDEDEYIAVRSTPLRTGP